jgi:hypothetical protein
MAINYATLALVAQSLIEANGKTLTISVTSTVPTNSTMPWRGANTADQVDVSVLGVIVPFHLPRQTEYTAEQDDIIRRGGQRALVACASTTTDLTTATLLVDSSTGLTWQIKGCKVLAPGPVNMIYEFWIQR